MRKHPGYNPSDHRGCSKCGARPTVVFSSLCDTHYGERLAFWSPIAQRRVQLVRQLHPHLFAPAGADPRVRSKAHKSVARAVSRGELPKLDGTIACKDCGEPAKQYDHRDYTKPLDVDPVCCSCNRKRGTALVWGDSKDAA